MHYNSNVCFDSCMDGLQVLAVGVSGAVSEWLIPGGVDAALLGLALTYAFQVHTSCSLYIGLCCIDGH